MRVTFWGTRGSIPVPGPGTVRYGGNTPCIAVEEPGSGEGRFVVLDAGTGIRLLGQELVRRHGAGPLNVDLLLSHTHWDHIQGLPFFEPLLDPGAHLTFIGRAPAGRSPSSRPAPSRTSRGTSSATARTGSRRSS